MTPSESRLLLSGTDNHQVKAGDAFIAKTPLTNNPSRKFQRRFATFGGRIDTLDAAVGLHLATIVHDPVGRPIAGERGDD